MKSSSIVSFREIERSQGDQETPQPASRDARATRGTRDARAARFKGDQKNIGVRVGSAESEVAAIGEFTYILNTPDIFQFDFAAGRAMQSTIAGAGFRAHRAFGENFGAGIAASGAFRSDKDDIGVVRAGIEADTRLNEWASVRGGFGYQAGDVRSHKYADASAIFALRSNLTAEFSGEFVSGDDDLARARIEWKPETTIKANLAFIIEGVYEPSDDNYTAIYFGLRNAFGGPKTSLSRRRPLGWRAGALNPAIDFLLNKSQP